MSHILVTGGVGGLGRELTPRLQQAGHTVRVMSRQARPANLSANLEWAQADIETGAGLGEAVSGVEAIIHAATNPARPQQVDVTGTRRLLEAARNIDIRHMVYVSIVGIDRIPFFYYKAKVAAEAEVRGGGIPYTILRATQFHSFIDMLLQTLGRWPLPFVLTGFKSQPIETGEVAARLCALVNHEPAGLLPDLGGPEVLTADEMAEAWLRAQSRSRKLVRLPLPGAAAHGFRNGYNTCPDHRDGKITWAEWVKRKYSR